MNQPTRLDKLIDVRIDAFSRDYVLEHMDRDDRVAKCMYEMGVDRDAALRVLQVVLWDELLKITGQVAE